MENKVLGRLEQIDLRTIWESEAGDFTPWLAQPENLNLLAETLGIELELQAREERVGPFRADILCKDTGSDDWVLIENQLEKTDHNHLGQLLTYAAGLKAAKVIWVAQKFTDEHRSALDWLNEITNENYNFFGVEIELWKIGDSLPAPKFNIVSKPNEWSRNISERARTSTLSEAGLLQQEFWTAFRSFVLDKKSFIKPGKPLPHNWMNISFGKSGFELLAIASMWDSVAKSYASNEIRAEVDLHSNNSKEHFEILYS